MTTPSSQDATPIDVRSLTPDDWPVLARLFGARGACGGCWCMWWRVPMGGKTWEEAKGPKNRERFRRLVKAGHVHGVLAFAGDEPVGWCSFGPRATFPRLERVRGLRRDHDDGTWSVVCFYIPARWRGRGVGTALLRAATERAFKLGAREVEGYPVLPKAGPQPYPAAFSWTGVTPMFEAAEYEEVIRPLAVRPIYLRKPD